MRKRRPELKLPKWYVLVSLQQRVRRRAALVKGLAITPDRTYRMHIPFPFFAEQQMDIWYRKSKKHQVGETKQAHHTFAKTFKEVVEANNREVILQEEKVCPASVAGI